MAKPAQGWEDLPSGGKATADSTCHFQEQPASTEGRTDVWQSERVSRERLDVGLWVFALRFLQHFCHFDNFMMRH